MMLNYFLTSTRKQSCKAYPKFQQFSNYISFLIIVLLLVLKGEVSCFNNGHYYQKHRFQKEALHSENKLSTQKRSFTKLYTAQASKSFASIDDESNTQRYLLAIPLEQNYDLLLELESVQRGIVHHCPALADACIMPVLTRLPLLIVILPQGYLFEEFQQFLQNQIQQIFFQPPPLEKLDSTGKEEEEEMVLTQEQRRKLVNDNGIKPLFLKFQGLELEDGTFHANEILSTVGTNEDSIALLQEFMNEIQAFISNIPGASIEFPRDEPQLKKFSQGNGKWRPRIPFMRIPQYFEIDSNSANKELEDAANDGSNGISPLFWYKWWDDTFTPESFGIRLQSIKVYQQTTKNFVHLFSTQDSTQKQQDLWNEKMFVAPIATFSLPIGNALLTNYEARIKQEAFERLGQTAVEREEEDHGNFASSLKILQERTQRQLQYQQGMASYQPAYNDTDVDVDHIGKTQPHIESSSSRAPSLTNQTSILKPIPTIKSLERYRAKLALQEKTKTLSQQSLQESAATAATPYPSDEHFVGVWRLVLPNEHQEAEEAAAAEHLGEENIILRIDNTIAGGPILTQETKQRAASGSTWKFFNAQYINDSSIVSTRLRIQLVIPPTKKQMLVLEGEVSRFIMPRTGNDLFQDYDNEDTFLQVNGEIWVQNVHEEDLKRKKLGQFSGVKLKTPKQNQLRYSIPPPKQGA